MGRLSPLRQQGQITASQTAEPGHPGDGADALSPASTTTTVKHQFRIPCSGGKLMRIDARINRFLMKNGMDRGLLSIRVAGGVVAALPFEFPVITSYPALYRSYLERLGDTPFRDRVRGEHLSLPVNLGQLVVGDSQHPVVFPAAGEEILTVEIEFRPVHTILKLTSLSCSRSGQIQPLGEKVERELNDPDGSGTVLLAVPNTTALVLSLKRRDHDAFLQLLESFPVPEGEGFYTASYRSAVFGQWGSLSYENGRIPDEGADKLSLVHLGDGAQRHDIYILQLKNR